MKFLIDIPDNIYADIEAYMIADDEVEQQFDRDDNPLSINHISVIRGLFFLTETHNTDEVDARQDVIITEVSQ